MSNIIDICWIGKDESDEYRDIEKHYLKLSNRYGRVSQNAIINRDILKKQSGGNVADIQNSYSEALNRCSRSDYYRIVLDPRGKDSSTEEFAELLKKRDKIEFFIGGAYGFSSEFRESADKVLHLSSLTMSHKIAKIVLLEQIYRGLTINNNHPYHK
jgi:23S rRNA (pseudouridine1915-N3)-methyltransferase